MYIKIELFIFSLFVFSECLALTDSISLYKLVKLDTVSFEGYNYYEFRLKRKTFKVISKKSTGRKKGVCYSKLELGCHYKLSLEKIQSISTTDSTEIWLDRVRLTNKDRSLYVGGNPNVSTYSCDDLCSGYIVCTSKLKSLRQPRST